VRQPGVAKRVYQWSTPIASGAMARPQPQPGKSEVRVGTHTRPGARGGGTSNRGECATPRTPTHRRSRGSYCEDRSSSSQWSFGRRQTIPRHHARCMPHKAECSEAGPSGAVEGGKPARATPSPSPITSQARGAPQRASVRASPSTPAHHRRLKIY
jgi:hypothetical protein